MPDISPLAPAEINDPQPVAGVEIAVARAGYKNWSRADLTLVRLSAGTAVAGVFTRSKCPSPEVEWCRSAVREGEGRATALVVNAGNANAFTGGKGREAVAKIVETVSASWGCDPQSVFVASTGVIGVPLPADKAKRGIEQAMAGIGGGSLLDAARAIMTTDTFPKLASRTVQIDGVPVTLSGIVKGSGMIAPDMATMLGFIFTDALVEPPVLQDMLTHATEATFNCITVDSDTSTSDTVLAFATGKSGATANADFADALTDLCRELAHLVVRDGEGASKFITVQVAGAVDDGSARRVALAIANSPLVKTAIAGEDANWGRVVMAVGKAGEPADRDRLSIRFGETLVAAEGMVVPGYDEAPVALHLKGKEVDIGVDLGLGNGKAVVWTCDLTHGYISINADYRS